MDVTQNLLKAAFYNHQKNVPPRGNNTFLSQASWWKEVGAFVYILPRQTGKTETVLSLYRENPASKIVVRNTDTALRLLGRGCCRDDVFSAPNLQNQMIGLRFEEINLFVDEFMFLDEKTMKWIYEQNWKSLNLISTLK